MQDIIKKDDLNYKSKRGKTCTSVKIYYKLFLRDMHEEHLSIEKADNKQVNFANEINNFGKGIKTLGKSLF